MKMPLLSLFMSAICVFALQTTAAALGTAFTYQGELNYQSAPANGFFDFRFILWDSQEEGSPVSESLINDLPEVSVVDGVFTVELDFGQAIHTDQVLWMEIEVRPPDGTELDWATLFPRQAIRPAPFALTAGHVVNVTGNQCDERSYLVGFGPNNELICRSGTTLNCGDGVTTAPEECDDGNLVGGDGCSAECNWEPMLVFLSSEAYPLAIGGRAGANTTCQDLAATAGLDGTFEAWISECSDLGGSYDCQSPSNQWNFASPKPYVRVDGVRVADNIAALAADGPLAPINVDENGEQAGLIWVMTGIGENGMDLREYEDYVEGRSWCGEWTSTEGEFVYGDYTATDGTWTNAGAVPCGISANLYCFEVP